MGNKAPPRKENFTTKTPVVAVCGRAKFIHFYRMDTGRRIPGVSINTGRCHAMIQCRLRDESVLAVGTIQCGMFGIHRAKRMRLQKNEVRFVKAETGQILDTPRFTKHTSTILAIEDLPGEEDDRIVSASADRTVRVWKKTDGKQIVLLSGEEWFVSLCCVPSKKWVVGGSRGTTIRVWDLETGQTVPDGIINDGHMQENDNVTIFGGERCPCILSGLSGSSDGAIKMFSLPGFKCDRRFELPVSSRGCCSLLFHPTREHLFYAGCYRELYLWDIRKEDRWVQLNNEIHHADPSGGRPGGLIEPITKIVSAGPGLFVSCCENGTIKVWTEKLKPVPTKIMTTYHENYGLVVLVPFAVSPPSSELLDDGSVAEAQKQEEERIRFFGSLSVLQDFMGVRVRLGGLPGLLLRCSPGLMSVE